MARLGLVLLALATHALAVQNNTWAKSGDNLRFVRDSTVLALTRVSRVFCGAACTRDSGCVSFNHNHLDQRCELLSVVPKSLDDVEMTSDPGWSFYFLNVPSTDPCYNSGCPVTTMCLLYDQPLNYYSYDPSLENDHKCSDHPYLLLHRKVGKTACRFYVVYDKDLWGYDLFRFGSTTPYNLALDSCVRYTCLSMVCVANSYCIIKGSSADIHGYFAFSGAFYFRPECQ